MYLWMKEYCEENSKDLTFVLAAGLTVAYFFLILPKKVLATIAAGVVSLATLSFLQHRKLKIYREKYGEISKKN